jgi:hypothetical protein
MESDVTRSIGNGVPDQTDRKRAIIKKRAAMNNKLPIIDLILNLMLYPIPITNMYIFLDILFLCLKTG